MNLSTKLLASALMCLLFSCGDGMNNNAASSAEMAAPVPAPAVNAELTQKTIEHHLGAFGANDLEALMLDYNDASVIITPDAKLVGTAAIREFFTNLLLAFPTEGTEMTLDNMTINESMGYIIWHATTPAVEVPFGTDTYIVEDGIIVQQTFAGIINPVAAE